MSATRGFAILVTLLCAVALGLAGCERDVPTGPVPIAWDKEVCAECRMLVGEPKFAVQLQSTEGEVLNFDDPGCALRYLATHKPPLHALYFHHAREDRWLTQAQVGFTRASPSPMGYDLGAVPKSTSGALSLEAASQLVLRREERPER